MRFTSNVSRLIRSFVISTLVLASVAITLPAHAHDPNVVLSGFGTAMVDGIMGLGEWDNASSMTFPANVPLNDGGGTTPTTLFVMNDESNIYLALKITRSSFGGGTIPTFEFDNNHNGIRENGDEVLGMSIGIFGPLTFIDAFRWACPWTPGVPAGCGALDTDSISGFPPAGTNDGVTAASNDGVFTIIEISHPLNSTDDLHDFSLGAEDSVGFKLGLRLFSLIPACNFGLDCIGDTTFPASALSASSYGDITIASLTVPLGAFVIDSARVELLQGAGGNDHLDVRGEFVLGVNSGGIDVLNEDVTVTFSGYTETIPAGSFRRDDQGFQFNGVLGGITQMNIRDDGQFRVIARELDLSGTDLSSLKLFSLQIGDDLGKTGISFDIIGRFSQ